MEWYLHDGRLIDESGWERTIESWRGEIAGSLLYGCEEEWLAAFEHAVIARARETGGPVGVLFSGGVDSVFIAFILHKHGIPFTCYTAGFQDGGTKEPDDIVEARRVAAHFGWAHKEVVLTLDELEQVIGETVRTIGDAANPVTVGVGAVVVAAARLAVRDGVTTLFSGLGSEEIFAGYDRHGKSADVQEECWNGLLAMRGRDLVRDTRIAAALGISIPTPFMDAQVIHWAMRIPASEKIVEGQKKHALRVMAREAGLPQEFAFRPKRAAQYGSRFDGALERLGRRNGGKREYISSLRAGQAGKQ